MKTLRETLTTIALAAPLALGRALEQRLAHPRVAERCAEPLGAARAEPARRRRARATMRSASCGVTSGGVGSRGLGDARAAARLARARATHGAPSSTPTQRAQLRRVGVVQEARRPAGPRRCARGSRGAGPTSAGTICSLGDARVEHVREPRALARAADQHHVVVLAVAVDADLGGRRPRAVVRAAGHADHRRRRRRGRRPRSRRS